MPLSPFRRYFVKMPLHPPHRKTDLDIGGGHLDFNAMPTATIALELAGVKVVAVVAAVL